MPAALVHTLRLPSGLLLEFAEQGRLGGPTVLMLHGVTDSWRSFEPVLPFVDPAWHVIALSLRGHGASSKPADGYTPAHMAGDVAQFIAAMELPPVVVVGHSMGATVALRLAVDHPGCVRAVAGLGTFASFRDKSDLVDWVRSTIDPLADPVPRELADEFQRSTLAQSVTGEGEFSVSEALIGSMTDQSLKAPARVWRRGFAGLLDDDVADGLHRVRVPVLLLHGGRDAFVPAADLTRLTAALPQAQAHTWAGAGHAMHWEQPARFAALLGDFVGALDRPGAPATEDATCSTS
jgi:non-heme chloroperoxidase